MVGPQKPRKQSDRRRTVPIPESLTTIPGYPKKLVIYLCDASSFWQARYFAENAAVGMFPNAAPQPWQQLTFEFEGHEPVRNQ